MYLKLNNLSSVVFKSSLKLKLNTLLEVPKWRRELICILITTSWLFTYQNVVCEGGGWIEDTKNRADYDRSVFLVSKMID